MSTEARVSWVEDRRFVGEAGSGHAVVVDGSAVRRGASPMELMLIGMAGCTAYDVLEILCKKRQRVSQFTVSTHAERAEKPPRVFTTIDVEYTIVGQNVDARAVEAAIRLSKEKYCSASIMLGNVAEIRTSFRIEDERSDRHGD